MSGPLADYVFWLAVAATAVAHLFILRSTLRGLASHAATAGRGARVREWVWAVLPAAALVALFAWTWHTMHPDSMTFRIPSDRIPPGVIGP